MLYKKILPFSLAVLFSLLTSCYSDYVYLKLDLKYYQPRPVYQHDDSNLVAFVSIQEAYRQATGITAFPDGGQSKVIYKKTGLYIFNIESNKLSLIKDLTAFVNFPWYFKDRSELLFIDSLVYYFSKGEVLDVEEAKDPLLVKKKYEKCYSININTNEVSMVDTVMFNTLYRKYYKKKDVDLSGLKKIPLAQFGLLIQDIYPKPDKKYIEETIYLKNKSKISKRAVVEQIISKLDKTEIKALLKKMDDYRNSLEGLEKKEYEIYSEETYKRIQALL